MKQPYDRVMRNWRIWRDEGLQRAAARAGDLVIVVGGACIAALTRFGELHFSEPAWTLVAVVALLAAALFPLFGQYESWRGRSTWQLVFRVALAWSLALACGLLLVFSLHQANAVSRLWVMWWFGLSGGALVTLRVVVYRVLARLRREGHDLRTVAIVGGGAHCLQILKNLDASRQTGFRAVAAMTDDPQCLAAMPGVPDYQDFDHFVEYVRSANVRELWLVLSLAEEQQILQYLNEFRNDLINIRFIPDMRSLSLFGVGLTDLIGAPAINLAACPLPARALAGKELFDTVFACATICMLAPLFAAIAVAVKLSSPGPVLFTQTRKGADGQPFKIYKFRSMRLHDTDGQTLRQAVRGDPRVTRVGAFLRKTSLDELPQFFNVLRGEMSVVGPRPHAIEHDNLYRDTVSNYIQRYRIKPGITGWAQINGFRGETDRVEKMQRRVEHDLYYIVNWSFALDIRIILATAFRALADRNAY